MDAENKQSENTVEAIKTLEEMKREMAYAHDENRNSGLLRYIHQINKVLGLLK
jgi:hypothetical protein